MTVASQLRLAIALLVIALTAILLAAFYVPSQLQRSAKDAYAEDVIPLRDAVHELRVALANQETAVEEYLRTNDDSARREFYSEVGSANQALQTINSHVSRHPELEPL